MQKCPPIVPQWLPYVLPLVLFLILSLPEQLLGTSEYALTYTIKTAVVTALLLSLRNRYPELARNSNGVLVAALLGPALTFAWLTLDRITPHVGLLGTRSSYDPFTAITDKRLAWSFIVVRFFGLTVVAPFTEELFYRGFLLRWVLNADDFLKVPLGEVNAASFSVVVLMMASAHPEYLAAAFFSAAMIILLMGTKNLWSTIAAHASTNFCLGVYILRFHEWKYW